MAGGAGEPATPVIRFAPASAKFIRINQTGTVPGLYWSIHELSIYTPGLIAKAAPAAKPVFRFE